ncbi:MAG: hypothetical protein JSS30_06165 [Verrucomicrobia bacterium]|nr:hypothetical protein [Verrucomicrobiota bacterium]
MKKLLITLGILMGCGVAVVLIAQAEGGDPFDLGVHGKNPDEVTPQEMEALKESVRQHEEQGRQEHEKEKEKLGYDPFDLGVHGRVSTGVNEDELGDVEARKQAAQDAAHKQLLEEAQQRQQQQPGK